MPDQQMVKCPWCNMEYDISHVFTYIIYTCKVCQGGFKRFAQKMIKVLERPPTKEIAMVNDRENL